MSGGEEIPLKIGDRVRIDAKPHPTSDAKAERKKSSGSSHGSGSSISATVNNDESVISGNPSGVVAFLGDTRFAKGEWAGVVLDPEFATSYGKNDGAVKGIR